MEYHNIAPPEMTEDDRKTRELVRGVANNSYLGCTREGKPGHKPRPTKDDTRFASDRNDVRLREAQAAWDRAERWAVHNDELGEKRRAEKAAAREAETQRQQAAADERTAKARAEMEGRLRREFLATPGVTETDWERNKQAMIDDHLRAQAHVTDQAARRLQRSITGGW